MKKVLITGGAGFIGSHLCEKFLKEGWFVIALDNLITGNIDNISHLIENEKFLFIKYNVTNYLFFKKHIDLILHFACPASPVDYLQHPIHTMKVDSLGTLNTLGLAKSKNARYVFASTSEVYGYAREHPQNENYFGYVNTISSRAVYGESKRFSETLCMAYHRKYNLDIRVARIFNTYGKRMRINDGRVIPNFITSSLMNKDMVIYGNGSQTRSFCYIDDLIDGIYKLSIIDDLDGQVFNLGNDEEIDILELAKLIKMLTKSKSNIIFKDCMEGEPFKRRPDLNKAIRLLNYKSKVAIRSGLIKIIPWFKERLE